jgi:hypothetical protein
MGFLRGHPWPKKICARYLVERRHQQCVVVEIDADGERAFHSIDDHVEIVVGAERDLPRRAAPWRFRTDVVELLEAGRIFQSPNGDMPCRQTRLAPSSCASARLVQADSESRRAASASRADVSTDRRFIRNSAERGTYARREGSVVVTEAGRRRSSEMPRSPFRRNQCVAITGPDVNCRSQRCAATS